MPLYVRADRERKAPDEVRSFYVDDSACDIDGVKHSLLGAITFPDESHAIGEVLRFKRELGLNPQDEIKWNSQQFTAEQRHYISENILPLLNSTTGFLVIVDGDKLLAATHLAQQLSDYCGSSHLDGFVCRFDKNIITNPQEFDRHAYSVQPSCVGWSEVDSAHDQLIQCADLFVGFQKLRLDFGLGNAKPDKIVEVEIYEDIREERELWQYLFASLRYSLWGRIEDDPYELGHPWKNNIGYGIRIFTSLPEETVTKALSYIDREYLGCIH